MRTRRRIRAALGAATATAMLCTGVAVIGAGPAQAAQTACGAEFETTSLWPGGFTANVRLTNLGDPLDGWEVGWEFAGDEHIDNVWNARLLGQSGGEVTVADVGYNARIPTNASVTFGFQGTYGSTAPAASGFSVNGVRCVGPVDPGPDPDPEPDPDP